MKTKLPMITGNITDKMNTFIDTSEGQSGELNICEMGVASTVH